MPKVKIDDGLRMYYESYDFTSPWLRPETVLLVHGLFECTRVWWK